MNKNINNNGKKNVKNNIKETWLPIKGFEGLYEVSNLGHVRSLNYKNTGAVGELKLSYNPTTGYMYVTLRKNNMGISKLVHRLVAETFLPNPNNLEQVDHINSDRTDNKLSNIRWVSRKFNNSRPHARKLRKLTSKGTSRLGQVVRAEKNGEKRYFKNARRAANGIGCSHVLAIKVLRGDFKTARGWTLTYIDRKSDEAVNCGVDFRTNSERGISPSQLKRAERHEKYKKASKDRKLMLQSKILELTMDFYTKDIELKELAARINMLKQDIRKVLQYSLDGELLHEWNNTYEAERSLGLNGIYSALHNDEDPVAGGYIWKYKVA